MGCKDGIHFLPLALDGDTIAFHSHDYRQPPTWFVRFWSCLLPSTFHTVARIIFSKCELVTFHDLITSLFYSKSTSPKIPSLACKTLCDLCSPTSLSPVPFCRPSPSYLHYCFWKQWTFFYFWDSVFIFPQTSPWLHLSLPWGLCQGRMHVN